jgi:outer membrane lipoprotein SlyB
MRPLLLLGCAALMAPLCACAPYNNHSNDRYADEPRPNYQRSESRSREGRVVGIEHVRPQTSGGGALLGAVVGGVLGHQVGDGRGRTAATGVGAIGGAVAGNQLEKNSAAGNGTYRITVEFDDGHRADYQYESVGDLRIGDRIRLEQGQLMRM